MFLELAALAIPLVQCATATDSVKTAATIHSGGIATETPLVHGAPTINLTENATATYLIQTATPTYLTMAASSMCLKVNVLIIDSTWTAATTPLGRPVAGMSSGRGVH